MPLDGLLPLTYGTLTLLTLFVYGVDKLQARRGGRRVPERTIHALTFLGGFMGAWFGRLLFRHKTHKPLFTLVPILAALLHAGCLTWWYLESH